MLVQKNNFGNLTASTFWNQTTNETGLINKQTNMYLSINSQMCVFTGRSISCNVINFVSKCIRSSTLAARIVLPGKMSDIALSQ